MPIFGVRAFQGVQNIVTIDPEKSRDCSFKNPGILADVKSRDPGIPGIPLGPGEKADLCKCLAEGNRRQESLADWPLAQEAQKYILLCSTAAHCQSVLTPTYHLPHHGVLRQGGALRHWHTRRQTGFSGEDCQNKKEAARSKDTVRGTHCLTLL